MASCVIDNPMYMREEVVKPWKVARGLNNAGLAAVFGVSTGRLLSWIKHEKKTATPGKIAARISAIIGQPIDEVFMSPEEFAAIEEDQPSPELCALCKQPLNGERYLETRPSGSPVGNRFKYEDWYYCETCHNSRQQPVVERTGFNACRRSGDLAAAG